MNDVTSSEEARREAEHHRKEIADTLDVLSTRLNHTVERTEEQLRKPVHWVQQHPYIAFGLSAALGFLLAGSNGRRQRDQLSRELEAAYRLGRQDAYGEHPARGQDFWAEAIELRQDKQAMKALTGSSRRGVGRAALENVSRPMLKRIGAALGQRVASRWAR